MKKLFKILKEYIDFLPDMSTILGANKIPRCEKCNLDGERRDKYEDPPSGFTHAYICPNSDCRTALNYEPVGKMAKGRANI